MCVQVHKLEKQLLRSKEELEAEIRRIQAQAEQIKAEVYELKNTTSHSIATSLGRVHTLQVTSLIHAVSGRGCWGSAMRI